MNEKSTNCEPPIEYTAEPFVERLWKFKSSEEPIIRVFCKLQDGIHWARRSTGLRPARLIVAGVATELR